MKGKNLAAIMASFVMAATLAGCANSSASNNQDENFSASEEMPSVPPSEDIPVVGLPEEEAPKEEKTVYIKVTGDGVNIRTGAGSGYKAVGTAEKSTMYTLLGEENGWYRTRYRNKTVYISKKYCVVTQMNSSKNESIEAVIAEGTNHLGTPYVYGAVRLHDGSGRFLSGFSVNAFDCSSLMQYMFYKGADTLLQVNTRTQVYQGKTVGKADLKRGDLMFFTNAARKNNKGVERIGHVAMYLGDNWILHTASDYAKIEQISPTRWSYFIQAQRMF